LLIGNSKNVFDKKLGYLITCDNFDIIRFNSHKIIGYEEYVGFETSYCVVNGATWLCNKKSINCDNKIIIAEPKNGAYFNKIKKQKQVDTERFKKVYRMIDVCDDYRKDNRKFFPTSGFMAVLFFLQFREFIYIYGFSHEKTHYYDNSKGCDHHFYDLEKEIFKKMISAGKIVILDDNFDPNAV